MIIQVTIVYTILNMQNPIWFYQTCFVKLIDDMIKSVTKLFVICTT